MQLRTIAIIGFVLLVLIFIWIWSTSGAFNDQSHSESGKQTVSGGFQHSNWWKPEEIQDYHSSIAIIYDFSSITPQQLRDDMNILQTRVNTLLVSQIILIDNKCDNAATSSEAVKIAESNKKMLIVQVDADEKVSTGRARIAAVNKIAFPFILFLTAGNMPNSPNFLENMLLEVRDNPDRVVCPSTQNHVGKYQHFSWSLELKWTDSDTTRKVQPAPMPLVDNSAFLIRSDLYKAVGGYDKFFYKSDSADGVAFSLSIWLCGGSIVRTKHAQVNYPLSSGGGKIEYLQHAKYIQQVFSGSLADHFTYPGIDFYQTSSYDLHSIQERRGWLKNRGCLTMDWYAHKFADILPLKRSKLYNPNYKPLLPVYSKSSPHIGQWFVLFAGQCVKVTADGVLGLSWCPPQQSDEFIFNWEENGQVKTKAKKCVAVRANDSYLAVEDCKATVDNTQHFTYQKNNRFVISKQNGECVTHFSGEKGRQVLRPMPCEDDSPFNKFVINDSY